MKKIRTAALLLGIVLGGLANSGCYFSAAQLSDWVAGEKGLTGLLVGTAWDLNVPSTVNPTGEKITQAFLDLGRRVSIHLATNAVNQEIPVDPGTIR